MAEGNAISVKIGAETDGIEQGLRSIQSSLGRLENSSKQSGDIFDASFGKIAGATAVGQLAVKAFTGAVDAAFAGVRNTIQGFTDALDLGGKLSDLSASTGETAGNLLLLQRAFDNTGAGADAVGPALAKLQNNIFGAGEDSKAAAAAFGRMGISLDEIAGKTPTEQLALVAAGISGIEDPAARAATAIDIFGKSGAQLLPLLTNFQGEMSEASATVGSLADIMDRRANVFDAVGDRFLVIQQKVRDFAAGILDRALPAIDAITSALTRIDAAAIGQRLADAFLGGQEAMKGFQAAVDAISIGNAPLAFKAFFESLKLQAMQTADAVYKTLAAGFQTAGEFLAEVFGPGSGTFTTVVDAFGVLGLRVFKAFAAAFQEFLPDFNRQLISALELAMKIAPGVFGPATLGIQASIAAMKTLGVDMESIDAKIAQQQGKFNASFDSFKQNATAAGAALGNSFEENSANVPGIIDGIAAQQAKVAALEGEVAAATAATTAERAKQAELTEKELAKRQEEKDKQAKADAQAKADKTALIELETQINTAKAAGNTELVASLEKEIQRKKTNEEIAKLTADYEKNLNLTNKEAGILATNFVNAKNAAASVKVDNTTVSSANKESAGAAENIKKFASWIDYIKGTKPEEPVKKLSEKSADARKEIAAFGEYIGTDLSRLAFPDIAKKLGVSTLGLDGSEQIDAILAHLESERTKLQGIVPVDESASKEKINALGTHLEESMKKSVDLALNSSEGSKILGTIERAVEAIKIAVENIEPKLPVAALV